LQDIISTYLVALSSLIISFSISYISSSIIKDSFNILISSLIILIVTILVVLIKRQLSKVDYKSQQVSILYENATEAIILTDESGIIVFANPRAQKLFGYSENELKSKTVDILVPRKARSNHHIHRSEYVKKPETRPMGIGRDLYAVKKNGEEFPVEISLSHFVNNDEKYVVAFIIDISIRKSIEEKLIMQKKELEVKSTEITILNTNLEKKIAERTMMLKEAMAQLEQSNYELTNALDKEKELNELKSRFVSMASHEFRTPLSAILSSTTLISKYTNAEDQDKRNKHIHKIKENIKHLNNILEDLLSLGKLDEGIIRLEEEVVVIKEWFNEIIDDLKGIIKANQKINFYQSGRQSISTDSKLLKNIMINLISNASKFSEEYGEINVSCDVQSNLITIKVKDYGIGISKEDQEHLFERFFRSKNASNIEGTGLGLHLVKKYLKLLNGDISLESELNNGTIFILTIPVNQP
jgi:PAS domain S-box-containing protein